MDRRTHGGCTGTVASVNDDPDAAIAQHVHDAWDGSLRLVHITISDEERKESVRKLGESLAALGGAINDETGGADRVSWCFGETISFADFALAAGLIWARVVLGEDSLEWKGILELDGGKWKRFFDRLEAYQTVV